MRWLTVCGGWDTLIKGRLAALLAFGMIAGVMVLANLGMAADLFSFYTRIPYGDKVGHFGLIFLASFVIGWGIPKPTLTAWLPWSVFLFGIFILLEEISQNWIAVRTFSLADLAADGLGIGIALICIHLSNR